MKKFVFKCFSFKNQVLNSPDVPTEKSKEKLDVQQQATVSVAANCLSSLLFDQQEKEVLLSRIKDAELLKVILGR